MQESMHEILTQLRKPFHPSQIAYRPGAVGPDQHRATGLFYGDMKAYMDRLDEVCGLDWSVSYTPWGDRIICHLTIHGITRSSTGEPDCPFETAEGQAFRRACAMFGLGRYLYTLPSVWVEYNRESRDFSERGRARLEQIVSQHYRRNMEPETSELSEVTA